MQLRIETRLVSDHQQSHRPQVRYLLFRLLCFLLYSRIVLTAVLLCSKFYNDVYYSNEQVAQLGGVHFREMNLLEGYFLEVVEFRLFILESEYSQFFEGLKLHILELARIQQQSEQAFLQAFQQ